MKKRVLSVLLSVVMIALLLTGCGKSNQSGENNNATTDTNESSDSGSTTSEATTSGDTGSSYKDTITIDVFDSGANYMGVQTGWFADIVKKKFNMELNIISPNVGGGGDTLYQTRSAAGNLGDLIIMTTAGGKLQNLVDAGLVQDMTDYIANEPNLKQYTDAINYTNGKMCTTAGQWCVPAEVSTRTADTMLGGTNPNSGNYLRWDLYKQLGYPEINTFEDLLPIMKQMQDMTPTSDSGKKVYAFSLFPDWDGTFMQAGTWLMADYGYGTMGFALAAADDSFAPESGIDSNSAYIRGLKFLFNANQMGILDPDSSTQNYDTLSAKYKDGAVLWTPYPWLGQSAYNTDAHTSQGKGIELAEVKDEKIYAWGCYSKGNPNNAVMIGKNAKDPQRIADFIDWLYSPEGICVSTGQTSGSSGPEGLTWELQDGKPVLTDFGKEAFLSGDPEMPAEYGGGKWSDGISQLNYTAVSNGEINPDTTFPYNYQLWDSVTSTNVNPADQDWQTTMSAKNPIEFLTSKDQLLVSPGSGYAPAAEDSQITAVRKQCESTIVDYSWKAVYAKDEAEFNSLIKEMQDTCIGLGYNDVLAVDMAHVDEQKALRQEVLK
jgi:putative aldouronate transport system substrate-binding protein